MTLRLKFIIYLILIHLVFAGGAVYFLLENRVWLFSVELFVTISFLGALYLFNQFFRPIELIASGADFLRENDFTTTLTPSGQKEIDKIVLVYNDMIQSLRDERVRLQEQHFFLDKLIWASPSAIILLDYDGAVSLINPSAKNILSLTIETAIGKKLSTIPISIATDLDLLKLDESSVLSLPTGRKVRCRKAEFIDRGFPRKFIIVEELTEELRESEKRAYEKVIRLLSHEVNNSAAATNSLLNACLNYAAQLKDEDRADFENALRIAITRTEQLSTFMKSFADVIKLPVPKKQLCNVQSILETIVKLFSAKLIEKQIEVVWKFESQPEAVWLDKIQIEQVFINIIKNAGEAIGEKGKIIITFSRNAVKIEDTGNGFSAEVKKNLFTPFYSTKEHGQGIGLTLVQEILTAHNFKFSLQSEPNMLTTFRVQFF